MNRFRHGLWLAAALLSLISLIPAVYAESDRRMIVEVSVDEEGNVPSVHEAIQLALPLLWDRIVDSKSRASLSDSMKATPFLERVVPRSDGVQVTFSEARVWQYLNQHEIPHLKQAPHLNLMIQMINQNGSDMPQSAELLQAYAESSVEARGIMLSEPASALIVIWQWIDASQVNLTVRGNSALAEYSETRDIETGDPLIQLQDWIDEILLAARDAHISNSAKIGEMLPLKETRDGGIEAVLTIEQPATLSAQVALEDALRQHEKVIALTPTYLSAPSRQYRLQLKGEEDTWVVEWFQRRGMQVLPTPHGWLVH